MRRRASPRRQVFFACVSPLAGLILRRVETIENAVLRHPRRFDAATTSMILPPAALIAGDVGVTITLGSMPAAKSPGTAATPLDTSKERIEPGASSGRAS